MLELGLFTERKCRRDHVRAGGQRDLAFSHSGELLGNGCVHLIPEGHNSKLLRIASASRLNGMQKHLVELAVRIPPRCIFALIE